MGIFKPESSSGLQHLDDPKTWINGPGVEHNPLPKLTDDHIIGTRDTLFDPPDFRVLHSSNAGCAHHILVELRRQGPLCGAPAKLRGTGTDSPLCRGVLAWLAGTLDENVFEMID